MPKSTVAEAVPTEEAVVPLPNLKVKNHECEREELEEPDSNQKIQE